MLMQYQRAKKEVCHSLGLVDFAIGLENSVFNLPHEQGVHTYIHRYMMHIPHLAMFFEEFE